MNASIVIPVAREGADLYERIRALTLELGSLEACKGLSFDIILVSDVFDSPTLKSMMRLSRQGLARAYFLTRRVGKGGSVKNVIGLTKGEVTVVLDADIPVSPRIICRSVRVVANGGLDLLLANRVYRSHSIVRRLLSLTYNALVNVLFRTGLRDHQAGFKVFKTSTARVILALLTRTDGLAYDTEAIVWTRRRKARYKTVDVSWIERRPNSTISTLKALIAISMDLAALRLITLGSKYRALVRVRAGKIIDLSNVHVLGSSYMTIIRGSGAKKKLLSLLVRFYIALTK